MTSHTMNLENIWIRLLIVWLASVGASVARTQSDQDTLIERFSRADTMVTMRDGVRLHLIVYEPKNSQERLPIILLRTPYGIDGSAGLFRIYLRELGEEGYIFAFEDIRGRFKSEGKFVMQRQTRDHGDPKSVDESSDTYDTIEWLLKNVANNNGRVGMLGISYDGWLTVQALYDPHPALKCVSPQASPADMYLGDDFHHNGAFRLSYGFEYAALMEISDTNYHFRFDRYDTYDWYLSLGALSNVNAQYFHSKLPTWNDFVNHPDDDSFWQRQAFQPSTRKMTVPTLSVAGWWDQEDFYGPLKIYEGLEKMDSSHLNYLVVGPWNHGGWARRTGDSLGSIDFESSTSKYFRENIQAPWFSYFLKGNGTLSLREATLFQTGTNRWESYDAWPPQERIINRNLYFQPDGKLAFEEPSASKKRSFDEYISDPAHPVPYRPRPIEPTYNPGGSGWYTWLVKDQRFVQDRPDVLSFETDTLGQDIAIAGDIVAHLFASTTGADCDWIVKLIDVYPEDYPRSPKMGGYELMIADEVVRARYLKSFQKPEPIIPGQVNEYVIDLHTNDHAFMKGHRIMVQVQSTWFPLIDRNPQTFVGNIFEAKDSDYRVATQRVYHSKRYPSHIALPVVIK